MSVEPETTWHADADQFEPLDMSHRSSQYPHLNIAMLPSFDALKRERSLSCAAVSQFLRQPAVSASLKRLREKGPAPPAYGDTVSSLRHEHVS